LDRFEKACRNHKKTLIDPSLAEGGKEFKKNESLFKEFMNHKGAKVQRKNTRGCFKRGVLKLVLKATASCSYARRGSGAAEVRAIRGVAALSKHALTLLVEGECE
jgi:hypothetical protein